MFAPPTVTFSTGLILVVYGASLTTTSTSTTTDNINPDQIGFFLNTPSVLTTGGANRIGTMAAMSLSSEIS
jgi:formate/nitrite transporter FocA (FNT family)